ncbi:MAG: alkaline phosphatase [Verrucomicrobiota bacterium JB023]|nr:alkaline phosphatase [Verrucomicrobiota bacterium JB023]
MKISRRHLFQAGLTAGAGSLLLPGSARAEKATNPKRPRGIVFLVSDGMSQGILPMTEALSQQVRGKGTTWWNLLSESGVVHGLMDTPSSNSLVTDSAAASTAWSAGKRVPNGQICVDANGKTLESIGETLVKQGAKLGLVSTARITHATPAGFATQSPNRDDEDFIAPQFLNRAEILLGGGAAHFDAKKRQDGKDVFSDYEKAGYEVFRSRDEMLNAKSGKLLGLFWDGHLPYTLDRNHSKAMQKKVPTLAEMSEVALQRFLSSSEPFLLQIEGARIDHAAHANDVGSILRDQMAFDDAVAKVITLLAERDDILVVMTSDHGNANPALNGTGVRYRKTNEHFERIAGLKVSHEALFAELKKKKPATQDFLKMAREAFGFDFRTEEAEVLLDSISGREVLEWSHQHNNPPGILGQIVGNHTGTGWTGVSHTADPTQLTAFGPGAENFAGLVKNDAVRDRFLNLLFG